MKQSKGWWRPSSGDGHPRIRSARWVVVMLMLAGCTTVGPDFVQPKTPALGQWQGAGSTFVTQKPVEQVRWWDVFVDPVLSRLVDLAYQNNYSLKIAGLKVLEARARLN